LVLIQFQKYGSLKTALGSQNIILSQGSGANITIPAGDTKVVYSDGAGAGAAFVDAFASINVGALTAGTLTVGSGSVTDSSGAISFGNENLTTTGIVTAAGTSVFTNLDISGDIDVDGTTNLDVVDIDGAVDMASTALVTGVLTANGGAVFNEAGADVDFRVESDTVDHALFVQGSDGNVGIGTSSPSVNTEIRGSASNGQLRLGGSTTATYANIYSDNDGVLILGADAGNNAANSYFGVEVDGSERMRIDSSGQLLLGTTTSDSTLSVDIQNTSASSNNTLVRIKNTFASEDAGLIIDGNNGGQQEYRIGVNTFTNASDLTFSGGTGYRFYTGSNERMRIDSSGNVLVGTTSSTASSGQTSKLQVAGGIRSTSGFTSSIDVGTIAQNATTSVTIPHNGLWMITNGANLSALILITLSGGSTGVQLVFSTSTDVVVGGTSEPAGGTYLRIWMSGSAGTLEIKNVNAYTGPYNMTPLATGTS
jgi:hypothetical protein